MMKRILKWIGIGLGALLALLIVAVIATYLTGSNRLAKAPDVTVAVVTAPTDSDSVAYGEHLAKHISACSDCHGENLSGKVFLDDPTIGMIVAPNLTAGNGGVGADYSDEDWAGAIRHGIGADGRTLTLMPSNAYAHLSDEDLGALIAYLKSAPPLDNELPQRAISFPGTLIFGLLAYGDHAVSKINHANVGGEKPEQGATAEYGEYLALIGSCHECHGADLAGRSLEEARNGPPAAPNLTQSGELGTWDETDFIASMRSGSTPSGRPLSDEMPWREYGQMSDVELAALWAYLTTLDPAIAARQ